MGFFAFDGFVNIEEAKRAGLNLREISSPYDLWNSSLPQSAYGIFGLPEDPRGVEEVRELPSYRGFDSDKRFVKIKLSCGN